MNPQINAANESTMVLGNPSKPVYLLEWKGARTWDNLLMDTGDFIQGYIIVMDSTKPDTFRQAKAIVGEACRAAYRRHGMNRFGAELQQ